MNCQKCESHRLADITGKTSDLCFVTFHNEMEHEGFVPDDINIGGGDYIRFSLCLNCGQIQGEWPVPLTEMEKGYEND